MQVTFGRSGSWFDDQIAAENMTSSKAASKPLAHRVATAFARPSQVSATLAVGRLHRRVLDQLEGRQLVLVLLGRRDGVLVHRRVCDI